MFERLRQIRESQGLTCEQMAERMGLQTKAAYNKKENGHVKFTLADAKRVSEILGMSIDEIFFAEEVSEEDTNTA